jgi:dUTP pyrophosphatase
MSEVKIWRKSTITATIPAQGTTHARGYDVRAHLPNGNDMHIYPLQTVVIPTGLYIALPEGAAMLVCSRSGLASRGLIVANAPGVIDSDYRGECNVILTYIAAPNSLPHIIHHGDRIAQWVYLPPSIALEYSPRGWSTPEVLDGEPYFTEVLKFEELPNPQSNREGGFGSTGVA